MTSKLRLVGRGIPGFRALSDTRRIVVASAVLCSIWLMVVVFGLYRAESYGQTAGQTGTVTTHWPSGTDLTLNSRVPTLVLFVHPHCPCSRATLGELEVLLTRCQNRVVANVVFLQPDSFTKDWVETDLWYAAVRLPGATAIRDERGCEIKRFGARVSGETLLYEVSGELMFRGGITASRGHHGDNQGRATIEALLTGSAAPIAETPVFGCSLCESPPSASGEATCHSK
jgi:hypothetical protein